MRHLLLSGVQGSPCLHEEHAEDVNSGPTFDGTCLGSLRQRPITGKDGDYISLTDRLKAKDGEFFISDWLRNRNTVDFPGIWEWRIQSRF